MDPPAARLLCALALLLHWPPAVDCWSPAGHERVMQVAAQILDGRKRARVKTMMHGDLLQFSDWEERMLEKFPASKELHEHRQAPEWSCHGNLQHIGGRDGHIRCDEMSAETGSLFCALAYFFEHFAHDALLDEYPQPKEPMLTPNALPAIQTMPKSEQKPSYYLRWLSGLLGDLHQPLHLKREYDYGRDVKVKYRGEEFSLSAFWEDHLPKNLPELPSQESLKKVYESRAPAWWDKRPTELFREWGNETSRILCGQIFAALETTSADGNRGIESPVEVSEEIFQRWQQLAYDFTTLAGQRLAFVLSDILEHRRHRHAHKEGRAHQHRARSPLKGFLANCAIAALLVPALLWALGWHRLNPKSGSVGLGRRKV